ncbi:transporter substrate-binding domain-containing protein [Anaerovorax odorimutans]|uniref:Transporter substrate-binding domain-containing protein n=1 Tax=Anaerovorax odorimutans TaxID=109327 RepID=A0ABT1RRU6_9FIRM|nr:transporter substrate-binding domain-containing protein [Anaerovorax odorimutans]MCQ4637923.1 transporter substrate-binding domain-containing protein [Anaerovorax odorimutans]
MKGQTTGRQIWSYILILIILSAVLLLSQGTAVFAVQEKNDNKVIRVAFPIQEGLTEKDEHGHYKGYTYEYLEEISQYTGWTYEFVEVGGTQDEQIVILMDMLRKGEIDLMGGMVYSGEAEKLYDYIGYRYGTVETVLQSLPEKTQELMVDSSVVQTMRIAVIKTSKVRIRELEDYCKRTMIKPIYVYCEDMEEQIQALRSGRADAMLNTGLTAISGVKTVARFAPRPFYFAVTKGDPQELSKDMNQALAWIDEMDPQFSSSLYEKYFSQNKEKLTLTAEEKDYIENAPAVKTAILDCQPPYQYEESGEMKGISVDLLEEISQKTGLEFQLKKCSTPDAMLQMLREGEADMAAGMVYDYQQAREQSVSMTRAYASSPYILIANEKVSPSSLEGKKLALPKLNHYEGDSVGKRVYYATADQCIRAVSGGKADYTYVDSYIAQYYINQPQFYNLKMMPQVYEPKEVCFGVVKGSDPRLLSILNKAITNMSEEETQAIIYQNILQKQDFSISTFIQEHPLPVAAILICVIGLLLLALYQRSSMNRRTALELKKHLRIYELLNDYFFEYDYRTDKLMVTRPSGDERNPSELLTFDLSRPSESTGMEFRELMRSREEGIREIQVNCPDGEKHWLRIGRENVCDESGKPVYSIGRIRIIDEEKEERERLIAQAQKDGLTRILNARASRKSITEELDRMRENQNGAFLLIDIDHFKTINDTYGHLEGDRTLSQIAGLLRDSFRKDDIVGRPGGDEFLVYMKEIKGKADLIQKCETLCARIREIALDETCHVTVSIGAAVSYPGEKYDDVYLRADKALYLSKNRGRDQFEIV